MKNYYEILGVDPHDLVPKIKKRYYELARKAHPDKNVESNSEQDINAYMSLINEAYETLSDPEKRSQYDNKWKAFSLSLDLDAEFTSSGALPTAGIPYSQIFKEQHHLLVREYRQHPLHSASPYKYLKPFQSSIYSDQIEIKDNSLTIFSLIRIKEEEDPEGSLFLNYWSEFTPQIAVELFRDFLQGNYWGEALDDLMGTFRENIQHLRTLNMREEECSLYEGMLKLFTLAKVKNPPGSKLLPAIQKIIDYAKEQAKHAMPLLAPLFQDQYFRHLVHQSLHQYWLESENKLEKIGEKFDGQALAKTWIEELKQKLTEEASTERAEMLSQFIRYVHLLYKLEKDLNKKEPKNDQISRQDPQPAPLSSLTWIKSWGNYLGYDPTEPKVEVKKQSTPTSIDPAKFYREKAWLILDWMPTLIGLMGQQIIVNTLMQAALCLQEGVKVGTSHSTRMADEKIAFRLYLTAMGIAHYATPDVELYVYVHSLNFILHFKYDHKELAEIIPALQRQTKLKADLFPFFQPIQSNMAFFKQADQASVLILMRELLHALIAITEKNKHSEEKVPIDHEYATLLYAAYEACLKEWYNKQHNPEEEESFRQRLMEELLRINRWTFACVDFNLTSPLFTFKRNNHGWINPDRVLSLPKDKWLKYYSAVEGVEINYQTAEVNFFFKPWQKGDSTYNQVIAFGDIEELCARNLTAAEFSLDSPDDPDKPYHPYNQMRFVPSRLYESQLLHAMLLADYLLKFITIGREVQGCYPYALKSIEDLLKPLPKYLKQIIYDFHQSKQMGSIHRFWFEAEELPASLEEDKEKGIVRIALDDIRMVVRKHKMVRKEDGKLVDDEEAGEGWDIYVLGPKERQRFEAGKYTIQNPAMIWLDNTNEVYFLENDKLSSPYFIKRNDHPLGASRNNLPPDLSRLFNLDRDKEGKIITKEGYDLCLMSDMPADKEPEAKKLYFRLLNDGCLAYTVKTRHKTVRDFAIPKEKVHIQAPLTQKKLNELKDEILEFTSEVGHTHRGNQAIRIIYRVTREVARQTGKPHRYSPEYIFAHEFSLHYNEFAQYYPELGRLRELSKAVALIRIVESRRLSNRDQINDFNQKLNDPIFWWSKAAEIREEVSENVNKNFANWREQHSERIIREKKLAYLNDLKKQIGTLNFTKDSPEIKKIADENFEEIKRNTISQVGYSVWNQESWQVRSKIIDPQLPALIEKLNKQKFENAFTQLKDIFKEALSNFNDYQIKQIISNFLNGWSNPLLDALVAYQNLKIREEIQKVYPSQTLDQIAAAFNGSFYVIENIITQELGKIIAENKEVMREKMHERLGLDKTFTQMGLVGKPKEVDLEGICLWVPASVRHQVGKGISRMVYGGVRIVPNILIQQNNLAARLLTRQVFAVQQTARINSTMMFNTRPPQVVNPNRNMGNRSNLPPSGGGGGSGSSGGGGSGGGGRRNILFDLLKTATLTKGKTNQLEANLPDGTKVLFRRDTGKDAHPLYPIYPAGVNINHYNVEVQKSNSRQEYKRIENLHIVVNDKLEPIRAFTIRSKKELFNVSNFSNKPKS